MKVKYTNFTCNVLSTLSQSIPFNPCQHSVTFSCARYVGLQQRGHKASQNWKNIGESCIRKETGNSVITCCSKKLVGVHGKCTVVCFQVYIANSCQGGSLSPLVYIPLLYVASLVFALASLRAPMKQDT